jgi:hypothetical protein
VLPGVSVSPRARGIEESKAAERRSLRNNDESKHGRLKNSARVLFWRGVALAAPYTYLIFVKLASPTALHQGMTSVMPMSILFLVIPSDGPKARSRGTCISGLCRVRPLRVIRGRFWFSGGTLRLSVVKTTMACG